MHAFRLARGLFAVGFLATAALLAFALYLEHVEQLEPCPLCIVQRVVVIALGLWCGIAALHGPGATGVRVYAAVGGVIALAGAGVAGRHVWLQSLPPDQVPACGPGLSFMMEYFPLVDVARMVFTGSGECAEIDWTFLGLSIPAWTLLWFVGFAAVAVVLLLRPSLGSARTG